MCVCVKPVLEGTWRYDSSYGANVRAASGGRMTPVSLFLSTAGVSLTLISSDRPGTCPATQPGSCLIACHLGHVWSRGGNWLDNSPTPANSAKWRPGVHTELHNIAHVLQLGEPSQSKTARKALRRTEGDCLQVLR